ncbi:MAG: Imm53 family immunity protein [Mucilaginibacter sp.]
MNNSLQFLQDWYASNCDRDWEHSFGIKIETLDNPGWAITIDLEATKWEDLKFSENVELSEDDWFNIDVKGKRLILNGDSKKLIYLLDRIKEILSSIS